MKKKFSQFFRTSSVEHTFCNGKEGKKERRRMFLFLSPTFNSPPSLSSSFFFFSRLFLFLAVLWKFMHYTRINRAVASIFDEIINQFFSRLSQMALSKLDRDLRDESTFRVTSLIFVIASRVRFAKKHDSSPFRISHRKLLYRQRNRYWIKNTKKYKKIIKIKLG